MRDGYTPCKQPLLCGFKNENAMSFVEEDSWIDVEVEMSSDVNTTTPSPPCNLVVGSRHECLVTGVVFRIRSKPKCLRFPACHRSSDPIIKK